MTEELKDKVVKMIDLERCDEVQIETEFSIQKKLNPLLTGSNSPPGSKNIAQVHKCFPGTFNVKNECFEERKCKAILLERCAGGELFDYVCEKGRLEKQIAISIIHQILKGVNYMHDQGQGYGHFDLKPSNVMFKTEESSRKYPLKDDEIKIIDFGQAKRANEAFKLMDTTNLDTTETGTLIYCAPEIHEGKAYNESVDIWAIGCMAYTIVA